MIKIRKADQNKSLIQTMITHNRYSNIRYLYFSLQQKFKVNICKHYLQEYNYISGNVIYTIDSPVAPRCGDVIRPQVRVAT